VKTIRRALDRWYRKHGRRPAPKALPWSAPLLLEALEPRWAPAVFSVTNTADSGAGSLRQAILDSNGNPGGNVIQFNIAGSGVHTIQPTSALPAITE
jgi:hypothetical protein